MLVYAGADLLLTGYTKRSITHEALAEEVKTLISISTSTATVNLQT